MVQKSALFFISAASAALAAALFLLHEVRRGVPFRFETELALAVVVGLVLPLTAVALMRRFTPAQGPRLGYAAFIITATLVAAIFGLALLF